MRWKFHDLDCEMRDCIITITCEGRRVRLIKLKHLGNLTTSHRLLHAGNNPDGIGLAYQGPNAKYSNYGDIRRLVDCGLMEPIPGNRGRWRTTDQGKSVLREASLTEAA